jgi:glycosyltransferase involved in cell wall biosynthesis
VYTAADPNHTQPDLDVIGLRALHYERFPKDMAWRYTTTLFNRFPQVTTPSDTMQRELIAHGLRVPLFAISNGVDTGLFQPRNNHWQPNPNHITILHIGRLGREKRVDATLRAFANIVSAHPNIRLLIVGVGSESNSLKTLSSTLNVADRVQFMGFVPHNRLPEIYQKADIFVTASTIETQGLVVLEAMSSGLPIVGVDAMALPDLIRHGVNGYLVKPGNEEALAASMTQLIQSVELRHYMGRKSRSLALQHSLPKISQAYERLYQDAIAKSPRSVLTHLTKALSHEEVWSAFYAEGQALKNAGVERVWEISEALQQWTWQTFAPVVEQVRNGLPGHRKQTSSDKLPHTQAGR